MKIKDLRLHPEFEKIVVKFQEECDKQNFDITIYCGRRTFEEQAKLYGKGRRSNQIEYASLAYVNPKIKRRFLDACKSDLSSKIVTNAIPGKSFHNYGLAIDMAPLESNGKIDWNTKNPAWLRAGLIGESVGCEWAGHWTTFREFPHLQINVENFNKLFKTNHMNSSQITRWLFEKNMYLD